MKEGREIKREAGGGHGDELREREEGCGVEYG
jgi:hypothetical protein